MKLVAEEGYDLKKEILELMFLERNNSFVLTHLGLGLINIITLNCNLFINSLTFLH